MQVICGKGIISASVYSSSSSDFVCSSLTLKISLINICSRSVGADISFASFLPSAMLSSASSLVCPSSSVSLISPRRISRPARRISSFLSLSRILRERISPLSSCCFIRLIRFRRRSVALKRSSRHILSYSSGVNSISLAILKASFLVYVSLSPRVSISSWRRLGVSPLENSRRTPLVLLLPCPSSSEIISASLSIRSSSISPFAMAHILISTLARVIVVKYQGNTYGLN